ncbi:HesA/MoeB/ThiF family protein [Desulfobacterium sp. N47]|uniref:THIF-type NAD/FAD binding fold domain-containing protein n=1 Tax=uncultured Desulfobacterium sp. TaxID=201089 RepID=E1Y8E7_9BACT|nr:hypothetical protein N47_A08700 [uncultured Desulfobacterium sp.]
MESDIINKIHALSVNKALPDNTPYKSISLNNIKNISDESGISRHKIEIASLEAQIIPERYVRNMKSLSCADQVSLLKSKVSIAGLGGLGGTVCEILARIGIGTLNLIDGDIFEESNLNRQILSKESNIPTPKADAAKKRVNEINSCVSVFSHRIYLNDENASALIENSDVVIDCLDSIAGRFVLEKASKKAGCCFVSAAIAGSYGHITTIFPEDPGLKLIYGKAQNTPDKGAESSIGTLPHCVSLIASLECSEAIKVLLKKGALLRNKILLIDLTDNCFEIIKL